MLISLSIRDVVLIEALELEFGAGLSVLTGETGAGKSILLDALGLALGNRADAGLVRKGCVQASVTAVFEPTAPLSEMLGQNGIALDAGEPLIVRRTVRADGGSRAYLNDQPVSVALLRQVAGELVEIHGQHDDRGIVNPRGHRLLLDRFAGIEPEPLTAAHRRWRDALAALAAAETALHDADRDREWLDHAVTELRALDVREGEEAVLADRRAVMQRGEKVAGELEEVRERLEGAEGALSQLRQAARRLERVTSAHPRLADALAALDRALSEAGEAAAHLSAGAAALAYDPAALEADEARLFEIRAVARKHRVQPDALPALAAELEGRLLAVAEGGEGLARLKAGAEEARAAFIGLAEQASRARSAAAARLDAAVAAELVPLKLEAARFRTRVSRLDEGDWGPSGIDRAEFLVATNPGADFAPLIRIASGGELSRFMLALKVALAEEGRTGSIIFDEIDRGVGGAVASAIGERLARLAAGGQVLVVTHSPQVAARGDCHFLIVKSHEGTVTRTGVHPLAPAERQEEIARMLSGAVVTDEARAQAVRLLQAA